MVAQALAARFDLTLLPWELRVHSDPGGLGDLVARRVPERWLLDLLRSFWREKRSATGDHRELTRFCPEPGYSAAVDRLEAGLAGDRLAAVRTFVETLTAPHRAPGRPWIDMSPPNCAAAGDLDRVFADARFLHVVRSGLDVACSFLEQPWAPDDPDDALLLWAERTRASAAGQRQIAGDRRATLHLEQLVSDPGACLAQLGMALALPPGAPGDAGGVVDAGRRLRRWQEDLPAADQPRLVALYVAACGGLSDAVPEAVPVDAGAAREWFAALAPQARAAAQRDAAASRRRWEHQARQRWLWEPSRRLRLEARLRR